MTPHQHQAVRQAKEALSECLCCLSGEYDTDSAHQHAMELARAALSALSPVLEEGEATTTPRAQWAAQGEPDPHGTRYDCERAALAMGNLTDDELANGAFLNYDHFDVARLVAGDPDYYPPIAWMTAVKDRIRWLSRRLAEAASATPTQPPAAAPAVMAEGWRPIESAPKFETILIWQPEYRRVTLSINDGFEWKHATHWMPLPQPPAAMAAQSKEQQQ